MMRLELISRGVMALVPALLLTGCGVEKKLIKELNVDSPAVGGRAFGGQQPVVGARMNVVAMGTGGYGSQGTILASTTTDSGGNFSFAPGAYSCPQPDTPVYLMGVGGSAGAGENASLVLAAGIGACSGAANSYTIVNEVTTTALAFTLSHFFSKTLGGAGAVNDWFGGPSTAGSPVQYSKGLVMGNTVTIPAIVNNSVGVANQNRPGYVVETEKINTIANILLACVNSSGSTGTTETGTTCGKLFNDTANGATPRPSDTLQAAVQMALNPAAAVNAIYNLLTTTPAFFPYLSTAPNDWTIGVSYTTAALGLAVDTGTVSTLDIDASGRVWFPSNAGGKTGAAYFDPGSQSFNGPFNSTGLVHPQQVAIDANGFAWFNDSATGIVAGYLVSDPTTTEALAMPGTLSQSLTIAGDDTIYVGFTSSSELPLFAAIPPNRSSYIGQDVGSFAFPVTSMAADANTPTGVAVAVSDTVTTRMRNYKVVPAQFTNTEIVRANDDSGQVIYTGNDDIAVRSYAGNANDGLCIYSLTTCHNFRGALTNTAKGMAIDGAKNLWVAESAVGGVLQVPVNTPGAAGGAVYLNGTGTNAPNHEFRHGANDGGTASAPYGIGVDGTGNVWITNVGCAITDCAPGGFILTEIIGAGAPTITPISAQITNGNRVGTEPTN
jgi:hypothetical protein